MLETLLILLRLDLQAPEILLEEDGDLGLQWTFGVPNDFYYTDVSITPDGKINWADSRTGLHGTSMEALKTVLTGR